MKKNSKIIYLLICIIFFIIFNKYLSKILLSNVNNIENELFSIVYAENFGAAFSLFENYKIFLIGFAIGAIIAIFCYIIKKINSLSSLNLFFSALLIAGIFCNLYERITLGFVRDFIKLNFVNFPVFNISDIFINIGVFVIVISITRHNFKAINENNNR